MLPVPRALQALAEETGQTVWTELPVRLGRMEQQAQQGQTVRLVLPVLPVQMELMG